MKKKAIYSLFGIVVLFFNLKIVYAQTKLIADAGSDLHICFGDSIAIGGNPSASGGESPYTYSWLPAISINNSTVANPIVKPTKTTTYSITVQDFKGTIAVDSVIVEVYPEIIANAGSPQDVCIESDGKIGTAAQPDLIYNWEPATYLSDPTAANPSVIKPKKSTTYTLTVSGKNNCPEKTATVTVTVHSLPTITVYKDTTIKEGENFTLIASGASKYYWQPQDKYIKYWNTDKPIVEPVT